MENFFVVSVLTCAGCTDPNQWATVRVCCYRPVLPLCITTIEELDFFVSGACVSNKDIRGQGLAIPWHLCLCVTMAMWLCFRESPSGPLPITVALLVQTNALGCIANIMNSTGEGRKGVAIRIVDYLWQHVPIMKTTSTLSSSPSLSSPIPHSVVLCQSCPVPRDSHFELQIAVPIVTGLRVSSQITILFPLRLNIQPMYKTLALQNNISLTKFRQMRIN